QAAPRFTPPSSNPEDLTVLGNHVYFSAEDGRHGRELWRVDLDGNAKLIKDLTPGATGSQPSSFHAFQEHLYFRYGGPEDGRKNLGELWRTDGTEEGTTRVKHFLTDPKNDSGLYEIVGHTEEQMFLVIGTKNASKMLWTSNGTTVGTWELPLQDSIQHPTFQDFHGTISNGELYFGAQWPDGTFRVAHTDRITGKARALHTMRSIPTTFFALGSGAVLFSGDSEAFGAELWISHGTPESTYLLKDIYPGTESSNVGQFYLFRHTSEDQILFAATSAKYGCELWRTDGTPEGTKLWYDLLPGGGSSNPSRMHSRGNALSFVAVNDTMGKELWKYRGDKTPHMVVSDIRPGQTSSHPYALCMNRLGDLVFSAKDGDDDEELWVLDGDSDVAKRLADINPGPTPSYPYYTVSIKGCVVMAATSAVEGRELWILQENGTVELLADIYTDNSVNPSSTPRSITPAGKLLYFAANDIVHGLELWCSDGTRSGTRMVKDIFPERASSNPSELTTVGKQLFFVAEDGNHGYELWRSDGTTPGTAMLREINPEGSARPTGLTAFKGGLVFSAFRPLDGEELWIVEPGREPKQIKDINGGTASSKPRDLVVWKDHVYFRANDGLHGEELWRTDGTGEGTVMVKDIVNAPVERISTAAPGAGLGQLYLAAEVDHRGTELWRFDPDTSDLQLVADIAQNTPYDILRANSAVR
ncbi:MAG: hypothetical protein L3K26_06280, partial [Candidatus Hydrogenedentes bacterium]|nr:hypothetical protein [Candidatus Hydrogenedentota bacterium]